MAWIEWYMLIAPGQWAGKGGADPQRITADCFEALMGIDRIFELPIVFFASSSRLACWCGWRSGGIS